MMRGFRGMVITCAGLLIIAFSCGILFAVTGWEHAPLLSVTLTFAWMYGIFLWLAIFDSKRRWPGQPFGIRAYNMITFKR